MLEASSDEDASGIKRRQGGGFEQRIAREPAEELRVAIRGVIKKTIGWPSTVQSLKGLFTSGFSRSWRYMSEKMDKHRKGKAKASEEVMKKMKEEIVEKTK